MAVTITVNTINRCAGGGHFFVNLTVNGVVRNEILTRDELDVDPNEAGIRDCFLQRLRSYCRENNLTTYAQIKNAVEGKTVKL